VRSHSKAAPARSRDGHPRFGAALLASLALALMCGLFASASQAATVYRFEGGRFFSPTPEQGSPEGVAVDNQSGEALVTFGTPGVQIYKTTGTSTVRVGSFGSGEDKAEKEKAKEIEEEEKELEENGELEEPGELKEQKLVTPVGIAIDQAARAVYVAESQSTKILKYVISGTGSSLTFTRDKSFTTPQRGFGPGELFNLNRAKLAVDPTNGDLLVAQRDAARVDRFKPDGTYVGSIDGTGSRAGRFSSVYSIATDSSGSIYVVDVRAGQLFYEGAESVVERFAPDGTPDLSFNPEIRTPQTVEYDPATGNLVIVGRSDGGWIHVGVPKLFPPRLYTLHGDQIIDELDFPFVDSGALVPDLGVGGGAIKHLYAMTDAGVGSEGTGVTLGGYAFQAFKVPDIQVDPLGPVTSFTAQLSGGINPLGQKSTYHFEYVREEGPVQTTKALPVAEGGEEEVETPVSVSGELTDLIPNSEYEVRLVGTANESGVSSRSKALHFTTPPAPPLSVTGDAYDLTLGSATLAGKVNPYGQQASYWFEYGPTTAYGTRSPVDHGEVVGAGREQLVAAAFLTGLDSGTEYHYRLVATNGSGTTLGVDRTFTTKSLAAAPRVFEQVSPIEKGADVNGLRGMNVSPDGSHVMYEWKTAPRGAEAAPVFPRTAAIRSTSGWSFQPLDPAQMAGSAEVVSHPLLILTLGVSEDGTKAVVMSLAKLAPGAVQGVTNLYLRDTRTGELTTIGHTESIYMFGGASYVLGSMVIDGTPDYSHVLIVSLNENFTALPEGPYEGLYDFTGGELHAVSIAPDGTPMSYVRHGHGGQERRREQFHISDDGSKTFFVGSEGATYVRYENDNNFHTESTIKIGGEFCGASRDGHYAFVNGGREADGLGSGLWRFDTETEENELLVPNLPEQSCTTVSANGQSAYFWTTEDLVPGAEPGKYHTYVWHNGEIQLIANTRVEVGNEYMTSPNGRYFAFGSYDSLTGYDNSSKTACVEFSGSGDPRGPNGEGVACPEIFRYDAETQKLTCASCRRDGGPPLGHPRLGTENVEGNFRFQRAMLNDGTVIFDTLDPLSALDSNSNRDVYTFDGSEQALISSGFENSRSEFDGASADGHDIFFTTQDQLVGQDTDSLADIYDARVGGGIPGQNPPPPRPECIRDDCKATPNQGPELPFGGSEALNGPENVHEISARKGCAKGTHARKAKGKTRCVKQAKKQHKKQAKSNRRQGR
jgi:hypothetical protein